LKELNKIVLNDKNMGDIVELTKIIFKVLL